MKTLLKTLFVAACVLASTQSNAQLFGKKEPPKPVALEANTNRLEAFSQVISSGAALQHVPKVYAGPTKEVAIGSIVLEFITDTGASSKLAESGFMREQELNLNYRLAGVSPQTMQAIADEFYDHIKKAITDQGYTVLEQEKLLANADFAAAVAAVNGPQITGGAERGGLGIPTFSKDGFVKVVSKGTADLSGISGGFKKISLIKSMNGPLLFSANIVVNFAQFSNAGAFNVASGKGADGHVKGGVQLSVLTKSSFDYNNDTGTHTFPILRNVVLPSQIASSVTQSATSGAQMATSLLVGLLGKKSVSSTNYEVTAVDNYKDLASADLKMFAEVMAQGLKKQ
jgi:hypothetical protein